MNKYQLYTLGGALLAATSLAGAASAATIGSWNATANAFTAGSKNFANNTLSGTAATANAASIGGATAFIPAISFTNSFDRTFNLNMTVPLSGATFVGTPTVRFLIKKIATGTFATSASGTNLNAATNTPTVSALATQLFISQAQLSFGTGSSLGGIALASAQIGGIALPGVTFSNVAALNSVGGTVNLGITVAQQGNTSLVYESMAQSPFITAIAPLSTTVAAGTNAVVNATSSPTLFTNFSSGGGAGLTLTLATISITAAGAVGTDLTTLITADGAGNTGAASASISITVISDALKDAAATVAGVRTSGTGAGTGQSSTNLTAANFSGGSVTFTLATGAFSYSNTTAVNVVFSGTTAISAAAAGSVAVAYNIGTSASIVAPSGSSGTTSIISRGGLISEVNWANAGTSTGFTSYIRVHNSGSSAATASVVVKKDTTDGSAITTLGTYTTSTIPAGGTIQFGIPTVESALGITAPSGSYTLAITGGFPGYIQHLSYNGSSLIDLSGFRSGTNGTQP